MELGDPLISFHFLTACAINNRFWQKMAHFVRPKIVPSHLKIAEARKRVRNENYHQHAIKRNTKPKFQVSKHIDEFAKEKFKQIWFLQSNAPNQKYLRPILLLHSGQNAFFVYFSLFTFFSWSWGTCSQSATLAGMGNLPCKAKELGRAAGCFISVLVASVDHEAWVEVKRCPETLFISHENAFFFFFQSLGWFRMRPKHQK